VLQDPNNHSIVKTSECLIELISNSFDLPSTSLATTTTTTKNKEQTKIKTDKTTNINNSETNYTNNKQPTFDEIFDKNTEINLDDDCHQLQQQDIAVESESSIQQQDIQSKSIKKFKHPADSSVVSHHKKSSTSKKKSSKKGSSSKTTITTQQNNEYKLERPKNLFCEEVRNYKDKANDKDAQSSGVDRRSKSLIDDRSSTTTTTKRNNHKRQKEKQPRCHHHDLDNRADLKDLVHDMATFQWPKLQNNNETASNKMTSTPNDLTTNEKNQYIITTTSSTNHNNDNRSRQTKKGIDKLQLQQSIMVNSYFPPCSYRSISTGTHSVDGSYPPRRPFHGSTSFGGTRSTSRNSTNGDVKILTILGKEIIKLPTSCEQELKINTRHDSLGIVTVDCSVDEGINGCVVVKLLQGSACHKDGRIQPGDYLLSVNNEQMRNISKSSARAILHRANLTSCDVV
jgi:hypothetical protein